MKVAALFVEAGGVNSGLPDVELWDKARDAREYAGPHPVVAHPPCQRWGKLWAGQPLWIKRTGIRKVKGDDDGCFEAALTAVRTWGGIIEHPWQSHAWPHFGLNTPPREGGWVSAGFHGGWTCCVEQGRYGHYASKPTMLLAYHTDLPELDWGIGEARLDPAVIERMGLKRAKRLGEVGARGGGKDSTPRIHTPEPFRNLLLGIARSAGGERMSPNETKVLQALDEGWVEGFAYCFATLSAMAGIERKAMRRTTRSLARKGFAQYRNGLFNDDGEVAGSGYSITSVGHEFLSQSPLPHSRVKRRKDSRP